MAIPEPFAEMDALFRAVYPADEPGATVIVVKNGQVLFRMGYGLANLEWCLPVTPETVFRIGSVTKQFTAVMMLMLLEQGKLALEDPIEKYLPGYPTHGHTITLEHLLNHTSGIKSYTSMPEWMPAWGRDFKLEELVDFFKFQPMDFAPGARWSYNNSAYVLASAVIEKVTGMPYDQFVKQSIFDRLGMRNSCLELPQRLIPNRASGYMKGAEGYVNAPYVSMTQPLGAGGLVSTVDDLAAWDAALYAGKLLNPETLQRAFTPYHLPDGSSTHYGMGWAVNHLDGCEWIEHGGGIHGFVCYALRVPSERLFVAVLSNNVSSTRYPEEMAFRTAMVALGRPYKDPQPVEVPVETLREYEGTYEMRPGEEHKLVLEAGQLRAVHPGAPEPMAFIPVGRDEFILPKMALHRLSFKRDEAGGISGYEIRDRYDIAGNQARRIVEKSAAGE